MSVKEINQIQVFNDLSSKRIKQKEAAKKLDLSISILNLFRVSNLGLRI